MFCTLDTCHNLDARQANALVVIGFVVMITITAYFTRGLQLLLGSSKRGMTERAEELGAEDDEIALAQTSRSRSGIPQAPPVDDLLTELRSEGQSPSISFPSASQDPTRVRGTGGPPVEERSDVPSLGTSHRQSSVSHGRAQAWAAMMNSHLHILTYFILFIGVGLPMYYTINYAMPMQLCLNVLAYFAALALPLRYKRFLHPVLVSSVFTILGIWILALSHDESLRNGLTAYSTKTKYVQLFSQKKNHPRPGAGDVFGSVLDVSIVALALPMYQYRNELKRHVGEMLILCQNR